MVDLGELTLEHFSPHVDESFRVSATGEEPELPSLEIRLIETEALGDAPSPDQRAPFSLVFSGPAEAILAQGVYRLSNDGVGALEFFLVPIEPSPDGPRY